MNTIVKCLVIGQILLFSAVLFNSLSIREISRTLQHEIMLRTSILAVR